MAEEQRENENQTARDLAAAVVGPQQPKDSKPFVVVPDGYKVEDIEGHLAKPMRKRGSVQVADTESFNRYFNVHKNAASTIYADKSGPKIVGVFNDHGTSEPAWTDHRVRYHPPYSEEWRRWTGFDGKVMDQIDFARFLEENAIDIVEPASADVMDTAQGLQIRENVNFRSAQRLFDGSAQLTYDKEVDGTVQGRENLKIPTEFTICVPIFFNGMFYKVRCLLRYRKAGGGVKFFYEIHRRAEAELDAFKLILDEIENGGAPRVPTKDDGDGERANADKDAEQTAEAEGFAGTGVRPLLGTPPTDV